MLNVLLLIGIIFYLVVLWKFAVKTGRPGWSLYIPIYSNFVWCSIARLDTIWCLLSFVPNITLYLYSGRMSMTSLMGITKLSVIFSLIVEFYLCYMIAKRFNKGIFYAFGLLFLKPIFLAILAFSKKCYYYRGY